MENVKEVERVAVSTLQILIVRYCLYVNIYANASFECAYAQFDASKVSIEFNDMHRNR